jgi:hypothetical protein
MPGSKIRKHQSTVPGDVINHNLPEKRPQSRSDMFGHGERKLQLLPSPAGEDAKAGAFAYYHAAAGPFSTQPAEARRHDQRHDHYVRDGTPDSEAPTAGTAILQGTSEIGLKIWSVDSNAISSCD